MIFAARIQSESLVWPLAETGSLLRLEPRKSRTHAQLPTRCTDATCLDSPTAGRSFFPGPAATPLALDTSILPRPRVRPHRLRQAAFAYPPAAICSVPHLGGETTAPPFSTSASSFRRLPRGDGSDASFSAPFLAGTAGWRHLLRPGGTALLCFPATRDPFGFPVPPQKTGRHLPRPQSESFFGSPGKSGAWPGEQAPPASRCPARKQGGKGEKSVCIKTAFPSSASSATTHS